MVAVLHHIARHRCVYLHEGQGQLSVHLSVRRSGASDPPCFFFFLFVCFGGYVGYVLIGCWTNLLKMVLCLQTAGAQVHIQLDATL